MDKDSKKRLIASMVVASLGAGAYYLLKDDFKEEIKEIIKVAPKEKELVVVEKKEEKKNFWSGMTWEKLKTILGSRLKDENIMEAYYLMSEEDKMNWRRAVYKEVQTPLDKAFVYLDARIISQVYSSLSQLREIVRKYARNQISFEELYPIYRISLHQVFGIG